MPTVMEQVAEFFKVRPDTQLDIRQVAQCLEINLSSARSAMSKLTTREDSDFYHVSKNLFIYSFTKQNKKQASRITAIEWWEEHKEEEVTAQRMVQETGITTHLASRHLRDLTDMLSDCYHVRHGVYIWDEKKSHKFRTQTDIILDYIAAQGGAASLSQMEKDLGICLPTLCRALKSIQAQPEVAEIHRTTYVELIKDHRK